MILMLMFICSVVFIILDVEDMEEQNNADKANLDGSDHDGLQISQNWICKKKKKKKKMIKLKKMAIKILPY